MTLKEKLIKDCLTYQTWSTQLYRGTNQYLAQRISFKARFLLTLLVNGPKEILQTEIHSIRWLLNNENDQSIVGFEIERFITASVFMDELDFL